MSIKIARYLLFTLRFQRRSPGSTLNFHSSVVMKLLNLHWDKITKNGLFDIFWGNFVRSDKQTWFHCTNYHVLPFRKQKLLTKSNLFWSYIAIVSMEILGSYTQKLERYIVNTEHINFLENFYITFCASKELQIFWVTLYRYFQVAVASVELTG